MSVLVKIGAVSKPPANQNGLLATPFPTAGCTASDTCIGQNPRKMSKIEMFATESTYRNSKRA